MAKAFSMADAEIESESPGLSGVTMPIAPLNLSTGMTGARLVKAAGR
jgi:hypothetical protein